MLTAPPFSTCLSMLAHFAAPEELGPKIEVEAAAQPVGCDLFGGCRAQRHFRKLGRARALARCAWQGDETS
jgi:hypothetical protein